MREKREHEEGLLSYSSQCGSFLRLEFTVCKQLDLLHTHQGVR